MTLHSVTSKAESKDTEAELALSASPASSPPLPEGGLKFYWKEKNQKSLDGLPGLLSAFNSTRSFAIMADKEIIDSEEIEPVDESVSAGASATPSSAALNELDLNPSSKQHAKLPFCGPVIASMWLETKPLLGFALGWLICFIWVHHEKVFPWLVQASIVNKVWKF